MSALALPENGFRPDLWYFFLSCHFTMQYKWEEEFNATFHVAGDPIILTERQEGFLPDFKVAIYSDVVLIVLRGGPSFLSQLIPQRLNQTLVPWVLTPGKVQQLYKNGAIALWDKISPMMPPLVGERKVIVSGHSLGAALAPLLGALIDRDHPGRLEQAIGWGSPRIGDPAFAAGYPHRFINVGNAADIIFDWPPRHGFSSMDVGDDDAWTVGAPVEFEHPGIVYRLDHEGGVLNVTTGQAYEPSFRVSMPFPWVHGDSWEEIIAAGIRNPTGWAAHVLPPYLRRVRTRLPPDLSRIARRFGWRSLPRLDIINARIAARLGVPFVIGGGAG